MSGWLTAAGILAAAAVLVRWLVKEAKSAPTYSCGGGEKTEKAEKQTGTGPAKMSAPPAPGAGGKKAGSAQPRFSPL